MQVEKAEFFVEKVRGWRIRNFLFEYYKITGIKESCQQES